MAIWYDRTHKPARVLAQDVISATGANVMDWEKVDLYRQMRYETDPPPIEGDWGVITEDDLGTFFVSGVEVDESDIGRQVFYVIEGHHRTAASFQPDTVYGCMLDVEPAREMMVNEAALAWYDKGDWRWGMQL